MNRIKFKKKILFLQKNANSQQQQQLLLLLQRQINRKLNLYICSSSSIKRNKNNFGPLCFFNITEEKKIYLSV
jgi:hypothetical protein